MTPSGIEPASRTQGHSAIGRIMSMRNVDSVSPFHIVV